MTHPLNIWQQLQQAHLVSGDMPALSATDTTPPFFIRMLLAMAGWLAALFFCGFIFGFFVSLISNTEMIWVLGIVLCVGSIVLSRIPTIPLFAEQFVLACNISGQIAIVFSLLDNAQDSQLIAALMLGLELLLFILMGIRSQRAIALFFACGAMLWLLGPEAWLYALPLVCALSGWLWLNRLRLHRYAHYVQPASVGLTLALWSMIFLALLTNSSAFLFLWTGLAQDNWPTMLWIVAVLSSLVCLALAWQLIVRSVQQTKLRYIALAISIVVTLVNLQMPGLAPLCLLLCIGVALHHTRLVWFNLVFLVLYLVLYYYSLNSTLLDKSLLLCASGALLLVVYAILNRYVRPLLSEVNTHA